MASAACGAVPDAQRVTPRWVQESLAAGELQSLALPNNRLIYRPLPYRTPLEPFKELKWVLRMVATRRYLGCLQAHGRLHPCQCTHSGGSTPEMFKLHITHAVRPARPCRLSCWVPESNTLEH